MGYEKLYSEAMMAKVLSEKFAEEATAQYKKVTEHCERLMHEVSLLRELIEEKHPELFRTPPPSLL